eukprot:m.22529 g.22529  ORF g.22529 m.22529 type:complete len:469 (-) comp8396_c0_seq4:1845-3251(-)
MGRNKPYSWLGLVSFMILGVGCTVWFQSGLHLSIQWAMPTRRSVKIQENYTNGAEQSHLEFSSRGACCYLHEDKAASLCATTLQQLTNAVHDMVRCKSATIEVDASGLVSVLNQQMKHPDIHGWQHVLTALFDAEMQQVVATARHALEIVQPKCSGIEIVVSEGQFIKPISQSTENCISSIKQEVLAYCHDTHGPAACSATLARGLDTPCLVANRSAGAPAFNPVRLVVMTTYLTSAKDPQRQLQRTADRFWYMREWYLSIKKHGLPAIICHDGLSEKFQNSLRSFASQLEFRSIISLRGRSTNDARFYQYLELVPHINAQFVLFTDISDVVVQRDPYHFMAHYDEDALFIGRDNEVFTSMEHMPWMYDRWLLCFGNATEMQGQEQILQFPWVFNAGVIGGSKRTVIEFLQHTTRVLNQANPKENCNMPAVNYVVHKYFLSRVVSGYPWTSRFMMREASPKGVYIIHK